jgi:uncharacterized protein YeaO (DUF488 family)
MNLSRPLMRAVEGLAPLHESGAMLQRKDCHGLGEQAMILTKRAYEPATESDGYRVLIDRLWPRGVSKAKARLDAWEKDVAPSRELREWYGHDPAKWPEFRRRYAQELRASAARIVLDDLAKRARRGPVTLVYSSKAAAISDVAVLEQLLKRRTRASPARS